VPTRLVHLVIDAHDPRRLARFWAGVLGWEVVAEEPSEVDVGPAGYQYPDPVAQMLVFVPVADPKCGKNRIHLDVAPRAAEDLAEAAATLRAAGATPVGIGQSDVKWHVMADPEGNEFCVLTPR
jgi:catechol 2,3-dioxygenase-like lactoylglutathione lyase family enzyme